jgi:hypothetical protein
MCLGCGNKFMICVNVVLSDCDMCCCKYEWRATCAITNAFLFRLHKIFDLQNKFWMRCGVNCLGTKIQFVGRVQSWGNFWVRLCIKTFELKTYTWVRHANLPRVPHVTGCHDTLAPSTPWSVTYFLGLWWFINPFHKLLFICCVSKALGHPYFYSIKLTYFEKQIIFHCSCH